MNMNLLNPRTFLLGGIFAFAAIFQAQANILKLDDTNLLNNPAAWSGGVAPGSSDIAIIKYGQ